MDAATIAQLARQLHAAEESRKLIRLFSAQFPGMTIADAYAIQRAWVDLKLSEGGKIIGHKIGLTSRTGQEVQAAVTAVVMIAPGTLPDQQP